MIELLFACGHTAKVTTTNSAVPICHCGERRIEHVRTEAPRISGVATGPHCETKNLEPVPVVLGATFKES